MSRFVYILILFLGFTALNVEAQTWYTVVPAENTAISVTLPAGTVYRVGSGTCWSTNIIVPVNPPVYKPFSWSGANNFPFSDPCSGVVKELDVLETSVVQQIQVNNNGKITIVGVPALVTSTPTPTPTPAPTVIGTRVCSNYTETYYSDGTEKITATCTVTGVAQ